MNYPVVAKKAFKRLRFSAHEVWQNLRELKKNITSLVRNIDDMGSCLSRSRHLVQGLTGVESACMRGESRKNAAAASTFLFTRFLAAFSTPLPKSALA